MHASEQRHHDGKRHHAREDDEQRQRVERGNQRQREFDAVHQIRVSTIYITSRVDHIRHEKPRKYTRSKPQQKRFAVNAGRASQTKLQRHPKDQDIYGGFGEQPNLAERGTAVRLHQIDLRQIPDLPSPVPVLAYDLFQCCKQCSSKSACLLMVRCGLPRGQPMYAMSLRYMSSRPTCGLQPSASRRDTSSGRWCSGG